MPTDSLAAAPRNHAWRDVALILFFGAILVFPSFFTRDLWNPDEPRYMEVAREAVVMNDYIIPHLDGNVYHDKGPLFFWLAAGFYKLGFDDLGGRMVSGLSTLGTLLLIYGFGRRRFGPGAGLMAAFITATSFLFFGILKTGVMDPLLTLLETGAILAGYAALTGRSRNWWLLSYGLCGLAMMSKGPVAFATPAIFLAVFAIVNRKTVKFGGWIHAAGVVLMLGIVAAWLIPAMIRGGRAYWGDILLSQPARYTVQAASHAHGPHYYLLQLPLYLLPWLLFFGVALAQAIRDWWRKNDRDACFIALWFLCILVFFSLIPAKRERYLLPLMPAVGLLCARYFLLAAREGLPWPRLHRWFAGIIFTVIGLAGAALIAFDLIGHHLMVTFIKDPDTLKKALQVNDAPGMKLIILVGIVLVLAGLLGGILGRRNRPGWILGTMVATMLSLSLFADLVIFPAINPAKSSKAFCQRILPYLNEAGDQKYLFGNDYSGVINLHTRILHIEVVKPAAKKSWARAELLAELVKKPGKVAIVSDENQLKGLTWPENFHIVASEQVGHRGMVLLCNWGEPEAD